MKLENLAASIARTVNKHNDYAYLQKLKEDIITARGSVLASLPSIPKSCYQTITKFDINKGTNIFNEKYEYIELPKFLSFKRNQEEIYASNKLGTTNATINVVSIEELEYIKHRRLSASMPYIIRDSNIYSSYNFFFSSLEGFQIRGIFNNPLEVLNYKKKAGCNKKDSCIIEEDLEIEDQLVEKIKIIIFNTINANSFNNEIPVNVTEGR